VKSYLSLIPISARVHRRQNRMTLLCIVFAVFLVTGIFSMMDTFVQTEIMHTKESHGFWHIRLDGMSEENAQTIAARPDVAAASWYDMVNLDESRNYRIGGWPAVLCGIEEPFRTDIMHYLPADSGIGEGQTILTPNAKELLGVDVGDSVAIDTPAGRYEFEVTGFRSESTLYVSPNGGETTALLVKSEQIGAFINISALRTILSDNSDESNPCYYVQFASRANIKKAISEIETQCGGVNIERNAILMGLAGLGENTLFQNLYPVALAFFLMILLAGVLMIAGSLNSNIAGRTQFFGMMRCIGMSRSQVINFVRLEALNWCKTAIPAGTALGTAVSCGLCAVLKYFVGGEFSDLPLLRVSIAGIAGGVLMGLLTVLLSAQAPAQRAAQVSPVAAVSGNVDTNKGMRCRTRTGVLKIEDALGISHALSVRKNLFLMAGSFALSIILFLCFSVLVDLLGCLLPTKSCAPNMDITSCEMVNNVDHTLIEKIGSMSGVKRVFGRRIKSDIPATFSVEVSQTKVSVISYNDFQLNCLPEDGDLRKGSDLSKVFGDQGYTLTIWDQNVPLSTGDRIQLYGTELEICGMLKYSPFSNSGRTNGEVILICSEETFTRLTGEEDYAILDVQVTKDATDEDVAAVRRLVKDEYSFRDRRDEADRSLFYAFSLFIYGFLCVIALITVLNIVNSISMGVAARVKQYGAMRAVGMDGQQLTRMIAIEASTYALTGSVTGCVVGLPLSKWMYAVLITKHFPYFTWTVPIASLLIILLFVTAATAAACYVPAKRIRNMAVVDTINQL